ncbi:MAG: DUF4112 domain-containing protein [Phenylobacterium sp.]|uniref:DUF4112 domain-containing protein n=1 Tax=Phenylobacterium sp. TaxID=1871053 RepID=UPI002734C011|nr:DUF4112 domain-containing protein [Phenylobacterium sp.]MDP1642399.1 DUF4112 domain-containing protein [Phenylobacterium sp.]MDP3118670.1 DUF4112 domain-containing protein [Phenylobacterium sp.]MDP3382800.1 DUF4112 domain-containing protein [Phenylobacterium sp.]
MAVTQDKAHRAWRAAERIKRLSDRLVGVGPIGLGLDGILAWVPIAGTVYSVGAGALLIAEGLRGGASVVTLARMGAYLAFDSATSTVPVAGWAVDTLFPGHLMAAKALQKDIEARHGPSALPESWDRKRRARAGRRGVKI